MDNPPNRAREESETCRVCGHPGFRVHFERPATYFWHGTEEAFPAEDGCPRKLTARIGICERCGFLGLPVDDELRGLLERYSTSPHAMPGTTHGRANEFAAARTKLFFEALERLEIAPDGARVLEIGCQRGFLLSEFMRRGSVRAIGVEPGEVEPCLDEGGRPVEIRRGFLEPGLVGDAEFDLVYSLQVFEHAEDPVRFLDAAARALRPGGRLLLAVPNEAFSLEGGNLGMFVFQHLNLFTPPFLERLLTARGFDVTGVISEPDKPLHIAATRQGDPNRLREDAAAVETARKLLARYERAVEAALDTVVKGTEKSAPARTGFWGANAAMCNLFSWRPELANRRIRVFDSDPAKVGRAFGGIPGLVEGPEAARTIEDIFVIPFMAGDSVETYLRDRLGLQATIHRLYGRTA